MMSDKRHPLVTRGRELNNFEVPRLAQYRNADGSRIGMPAPPQMDFEGEILSNLPPITASGGTSGFFKFLADQGQAPDLGDAPMVRQAKFEDDYGSAHAEDSGWDQECGACKGSGSAPGGVPCQYCSGSGTYTVPPEDQWFDNQPENQNDGELQRQMLTGRRQAYKNPTYLPPAAEERFSATDHYDDRGTPGRGDAMEDKYEHDPKRAAASNRADILIARAEQAAQAGRPEMAERLIAEAEACMQGNNGIHARPSDADDDATVESAFTGYDDDAGAGPVTPKPPKPPKPSEGIYAGRRKASWNEPYENMSTGYAAYGSGADDALDFGD